MDNAPVNPPGTRATYGAIVLAAGAATRMGRPKQLIELDGQPLVVRAAQACLASRAWPVVVVVGAQAPLIRPTLARLPVLVVDNPTWEKGMNTSIRCGLETLQQFSRTLTGALIAVCDQPHLNADAIAQLEGASTGPDKIAAAQYAGTLGVPALFGRAFFDDLLRLADGEGAKKILQTHRPAVTPVDLPALATDLDTPADLQRHLEKGT